MVNKFHPSWHELVIRYELLWEENLKLLRKYRDMSIPRADVMLAPFQYDLDAVKVVIPQAYPFELNVSNGFAWGTRSSIVMDASTRCIAVELMTDCVTEFEIKFLEHEFRMSWGKYLAEQGVLLLVENPARIKSEKAFVDWKPFIDEVYNYLREKDHVAWLLWGKHFESLGKTIPNTHFMHRTAAPHTSNSVNAFLGSSPFSRCNDYLKENGLEPIEWLNL